MDEVEEVRLRIQDMKEENEWHISALTLPKNMFNIFYRRRELIN